MASDDILCQLEEALVCRLVGVACHAGRVLQNLSETTPAYPIGPGLNRFFCSSEVFCGSEVFCSSEQTECLTNIVVNRFTNAWCIVGGSTVRERRDLSLG